MDTDKTGAIQVKSERPEGHCLVTQTDPEPSAFGSGICVHLCSSVVSLLHGYGLGEADAELGLLGGGGRKAECNSALRFGCGVAALCPPKLRAESVGSPKEPNWA